MLKAECIGSASVKPLIYHWKSVQKTPTMKVLPRSLRTPLSYSLCSFRPKVRFNFGDSVAKWIKVKRWKT